MKSLIKKIVIWILTQEAKWVLKKHNPSVVAITGSVGKSSAKEAIFKALSKSTFVRKSEKSYNSEFGVPLTILGLETGWSNPLKWFSNIFNGAALIFSNKPYPKTLVLEVGADRPGDIKRVASWIHPDTVVITGVPDVPVHVEYFDSPEAVMREKLELAKSLGKDGQLIINGDDARLLKAKDEFRAKTITYGLGEGSDVRATHIQTVYGNNGPTGVRMRVEYKGSSVPFYIQGGLGKTHIYPVLAACASGVPMGVDMVSIESAFGDYLPIGGRMRLLSGMNETTIIDDTYNSSPAAAASALEALSGLKTEGRKIAVLADMLELGKHSVEEHKKIGKQAAETVDLLVTVGIRSRGTAQGAIESGLPEERVKMYEQGESERVGKVLSGVIKKGDVILIKGSQGMRMEKVTKELLVDKSKAKELLIRQDTIWEKK